MDTSDLIAVGTLCVLAVLGACGAFRWLIGALTGLLLGLLILGGLGLMSQQAWFRDLTRGYFADGRVTPTITEQMISVGERAGLQTGCSDDEPFSPRSPAAGRKREDVDD